MKNKFNTLSILVAGLLSANVSFSNAQTIDDIIPDFTPEEASEISKEFGTYTSAVAVFTGRNSASSGNFTFDDNGPEIAITNVPFSYTFGEENDQTRFRLRGSLGQLERRAENPTFSDIQNEEPELEGLPNGADFEKDTATSLTLGTSALITPVKGLTIEPAFDLVWTHVKRRYDYNNFVSALLAQKFDRDVFNNSTESITYSPSLAVNYVVDLGCGYTLNPGVTYTHLWSEDLWSKSQFGNFAIDSGVLQSRLGSNIPLPFQAFGKDTSVRPFAVMTNLYGAVEDSLEEDTMYEFGSDVAFAVNNSWFSDLTVGAAYITASNFDGYRFSIGAEF
jgi:hypothetical protein